LTIPPITAMTIPLQVVLIIASLVTLVYVVIKIRRAQFQIADAVFWVFFFLLMFTLGVFPRIGTFFSRMFGFEAAINFVLVSIVFVLLMKVFLQSFQISQLESKIRSLSQRIALDKHENEKQEKTINAGLQKNEVPAGENEQADEQENGK